MGTRKARAPKKQKAKKRPAKRKASNRKPPKTLARARRAAAKKRPSLGEEDERTIVVPAAQVRTEIEEVMVLDQLTERKG